MILLHSFHEKFGLISEVKKYMWEIHYALNLVTCAVFSDVLPIKFRFGNKTQRKNRFSHLFV